MFKKIEDLNFYELLEVNPTASAQEIHRAYDRIRRIYEPNSIALYSLFTPEETATIHQRIEEAYRTLIYEDNRKKYDAMLREQSDIPGETPADPSADQASPLRPQQSPPRDRSFSVAEPQPPAVEPASQPSPQEASAMAQFIGEFTGPAVKALREQLGLSLRAVADSTKVSMRYLEYIEEESYAKLPARTYIRGFLMLYAKALGCDPERMSADYLRRYDAAMKAPRPK